MTTALLLVTQPPINQILKDEFAGRSLKPCSAAIITLLACPNEIVLAVLGHVCPADILNFSRANKRVYSLSTKALNEFRDFRQKYGTIEMSDSEENPFLLEVEGPGWKLKNIEAFSAAVSDERPARYVHTLNIHREYFSKPRNTLFADISAENSEVITMHARGIKFLQDLDVESWIPEIAAGDHSKLLTLLLCLLPNLEKLRMKCYSPKA